MADDFSRRYTLFTSLHSQFLGFETLKDLNASDDDFCVMYESYLITPCNKFNMNDGFLFGEGKICIPCSSIRCLLVKEAQWDVLWVILV